MGLNPIILLGEDDEDFHLIMRLALEHAGFSGLLQTVRTAADLTLWLRDREVPALIIMDLHLPPNEWRATLRAVKEEKRYQVTPVYVFTTCRDRETRPLEPLPNCSYLQKPMSFEGWCACMEEILSKSLAWSSHERHEHHEWAQSTNGEQ